MSRSIRRMTGMCAKRDIGGCALNCFAYNFIKIHCTLRVSPAMAAGVTTRLFEVSDLVALPVEAAQDQ
jgi:hypothetical protein